jgi:transcriptional regulator with XRE-family HTH domain
LSQEEFGFRSGLHRTFISQIERGLKSPSLRSLTVIAKALETTADTLVREAERFQEDSAR